MTPSTPPPRVPPRPCFPQRHRRPSLDAGGCIFAEQVDRSFDRARIIWTAAIDPSVITVTAYRATDSLIDLSRLDHVIVVDDHGCEHVAISDQRGLVRLDVVDGTLRKGPVSLRVHLDCTQAITLRLLALDRLLGLIGIRDSGRRPAPADRRLPRLVEGLRVVDALAQGSTLADIAYGLSDSQDQPIEWPGDGEHLKSSTRRRVALARRLLNAGPHGILNYRV